MHVCIFWLLCISCVLPALSSTAALPSFGLFMFVFIKLHQPGCLADLWICWLPGYLPALDLWVGSGCPFG